MVVGVVEPHVHRQDVLFAQSRKEARLEERGLAQAGKTKEHGKPVSLHQAAERLGFSLPAVEVLFVALAEGDQARPRIVGVDRANGAVNFDAAPEKAPSHKKDPAKSGRNRTPRANAG